jgi:putative resolvase
MKKYVTTKEACDITGFKPGTLRSWSNKGIVEVIRTACGRRMYNKQTLYDRMGHIEPHPEKKNIVYCRVSTHKQKDDLERQVKRLSEMYPDHEVVSDVGSGVSFNRKGLHSILERSMRSCVDEIVVAHKDRLCRFGFELIEWIVTKNGGRITVLDKPIYQSSESELATDVLSISHIFSCRQMGKRRYKNDQSKNLSDAITTTDL